MKRKKYQGWQTAITKMSIAERLVMNEPLFRRAIQLKIKRGY